MCFAKFKNLTMRERKRYKATRCYQCSVERGVRVWSCSRVSCGGVAQLFLNWTDTVVVCR